MKYPNHINKKPSYWKEYHEEWKKLVNMTGHEVDKFSKSPCGKQAGLSRKEASEQKTRSGRDSAKAIVRMKRKGVTNWNKNDWEWCKAQVDFLNRFLNKQNKPRYPLWHNGIPTRYLLALLTWGHNPLPRKLTHYCLT
jgi:hypothetical protein